MNNIEKVLKGYFNLSNEDRRILVSEMNKYIVDESAGKKKYFSESSIIKSADEILGPRGSGCPCCGK